MHTAERAEAAESSARVSALLLDPALLERGAAPRLRERQLQALGYGLSSLLGSAPRLVLREALRYVSRPAQVVLASLLSSRREVDQIDRALCIVGRESICHLCRRSDRRNSVLSTAILVAVQVRLDRFAQAGGVFRSRDHGDLRKKERSRRTVPFQPEQVGARRECGCARLSRRHRTARELHTRRQRRRLLSRQPRKPRKPRSAIATYARAAALRRCPWVQMFRWTTSAGQLLSSSSRPGQAISSSN